MCKEEEQLIVGPIRVFQKIWMVVLVKYYNYIPKK